MLLFPVDKRKWPGLSQLGREHVIAPCRRGNDPEQLCLAESMPWLLVGEREWPWTNMFGRKHALAPCLQEGMNLHKLTWQKTCLSCLLAKGNDREQPFFAESMPWLLVSEREWTWTSMLSRKHALVPCWRNRITPTKHARQKACFRSVWTKRKWPRSSQRGRKHALGPCRRGDDPEQASLGKRLALDKHA